MLDDDEQKNGLKNIHRLYQYVTAATIDGTGSDLNSMLNTLSTIGAPRLNYFDRSDKDECWACTVEVSTGDDNVTFDIKSDYCTEPYEAVYNAMSKAVSTVNAMKGT